MLQQATGQSPVGCTVAVRFHPPPERLQRYFTTFSCADIAVEGGGIVHDSLHPEWANLRFFEGATPTASIGAGPLLADADFIATGPSARPARFALGTTRFWGIGMLPLGWARFVGASAADHANLAVDGHLHPTFAAIRPLADGLFDGELDEAAEFARIVAFFDALIARTSADDPRIAVIHAALVDPALHNVADFVAQTGLGQRTLERLCHRHFGFSPKLLLRRQRFMRSLAQFMLDPSLKWIGALDGHYHDQAQFVRDFREFMEETPREYAARPHPILATFMRERLRFAGAAVQTMDRPAVVAPPASAR